jgi:hypothetical protein
VAFFDLRMLITLLVSSNSSSNKCILEEKKEKEREGEGVFGWVGGILRKDVICTRTRRGSSVIVLEDHSITMVPVCVMSYLLHNRTVKESVYQ